MYKNLLSRIRRDCQIQESGFSLSDLLVGAGLTTLVIAGGGVAIANMVDGSTSANAKSERRVEINRALDFISAEVSLSSDLVEVPQMPGVLSDKIASSSLGIDTSSIAPVLQINLPGAGDATLSGDPVAPIAGQPVTYFTAAANNGSWRGPQVLYRWGPNITANGDYENAATPNSWEVVALADRLESFTATVSGDSVQLNPVGQIKRLFGRTEDYAIEQSAGRNGGFVARSNFSPFLGTSGTVSSLFTVTHGNIRADVDSQINVEFLGGQVTCGEEGRSLATFVRATLRDPNGNILENSGFLDAQGEGGNYAAAAGTTLNLEGFLDGSATSGSGCENVSALYDTESDQNTQVRTLVNGEVVPELTPFGQQRAIHSFLENYIDENTGRVTIAPNEVIILYELGSTDPSEAAYDLQDTVVLATITPTHSTSTSSSTTTTTTSTNSSSSCSNGLGNGADGCTPGNARPNDAVVRDPLGNVISAD